MLLHDSVNDVAKDDNNNNNIMKSHVFLWCWVMAYRTCDVSYAFLTLLVLYFLSFLIFLSLNFIYSWTFCTLERHFVHSHFIISGFCLVAICEPIPGISHVSTTLHFFSQWSFQWANLCQSHMWVSKLCFQNPIQTYSRILLTKSIDSKLNHCLILPE